MFAISKLHLYQERKIEIRKIKIFSLNNIFNSAFIITSYIHE